MEIAPAAAASTNQSEEKSRKIVYDNIPHGAWTAPAAAMSTNQSERNRYLL